MDEWAALADLLERDRDTLLAEWRHKVRELPSAQQLPLPTLNDHVPMLLGELINALRHPERFDPTQPIASSASVEHGMQRAHNGYQIGEVVIEYSMLRSCIHTLAEIQGVPLRDGQVRVLNSVLDHAIGVAVKAFANHCEAIERKRRDEHLAFVAHDLRTPLNAVVLATRALEQNGQQPEDRARMIDVLKRNVRQLATLVDSVLQHNQAALARGRDEPQRRQLHLWPLVQQLIAELQPTADFAATRLRNDVPDDLMVYADADMLRRVLQNLICESLLERPSNAIVVTAGRPEESEDTNAWCEVRGDGPRTPTIDTDALAAARSMALPTNAPTNLEVVRTLLASLGGKLGGGSDTTGDLGVGAAYRFQLPGQSNAGERS